MVKGKGMIDRPPEYGLTCDCGMRITGTNEKGTISLVKKHFETGEFHREYLSFNGITLKTNLHLMIDAIIKSREKN